MLPVLIRAESFKYLSLVRHPHIKDALHHVTLRCMSCDLCKKKCSHCSVAKEAIVKSPEIPPRSIIFFFLVIYGRFFAFEADMSSLGFFCIRNFNLRNSTLMETHLLKMPDRWRNNSEWTVKLLWSVFSQKTGTLTSLSKFLKAGVVNKFNATTLYPPSAFPVQAENALTDNQISSHTQTHTHTHTSR